MKNKKISLALLVAAGLLSFTVSASAYTVYGPTVVNGVIRDLSPGANLTGANLAYAQNLTGADLHGANLSTANLSYATNFNGSDLHGSGTIMTSANLSYGYFNGADMSYSTVNTADLSYARLNAANLNHAYLNGTSLSYAKLEGANLSNAILTGAADLSYAQMSYANLAGAVLFGSADLSYANLTGVNWSGADLNGADLSHSTLSYNDWTDFYNNSGALNLNAVNNNLIVYAGRTAPVCLNTPVTSFIGAGAETRCIDIVETLVGTITKTGSGTFTSSGNIEALVNGAGLDIYVVDGRLNISGDIASSVGMINKYGVGTTLEISGDIHTTSDLNVEQGVLALSGGAANINVNVKNGATLQINATNVFYRSESRGLTNIDVAGGGTLVLGTLGTVTDTILNLTGAGDIVLLNSSVLNVLSGSYTGAITSTGELIKDQVGDVSSTLLLSGNSTYLGGTTVRKGVLNIANAGSLTSDAVVQSGGTFVVNGRVNRDLVNNINGDVDVMSGAVLKGSGVIEGSVANSGRVAPGNSPGFITVTGNYSATAGSLDLELANNNGVAGTGYDQLRVGGIIDVDNGTTTANYSTISFIDFGGFAATRGNIFQVVANLSGNERNTLNQFDLAEYTADRVLFDHSTGRAYGTGLALGTGSFRDYGVTANQKEIGRALWMESVSYDKHAGTVDAQLFASTADTPIPAAAKTGYKAFILTSNDGEGGGEQATDLGLAAVGVLSAPNAGAALDSLSPEAYAGITDHAVNVSRSFVRKTFLVQHRQVAAASEGATKNWTFDIGYANDELTSDGTSGYTSYKSKSDEVSVSASRSIGKQLLLTVGVGSSDGSVSAQNFHSDIKTGLVGLGLSFTPESNFGRFDIGVAVSSADWNSNRGGASISEKNQHSLSAGARFTLSPMVKKELSFEPYVGIAYARSHVDGFTESDQVGSVQLAVDRFSRQSLQSELGLDVAYKINSKTTLVGMLGWEHEFRDSGKTAMTANFIEAGVDDTRFTVNANGSGADLFRVGLNLRYDINSASAVTVGYNAIMGSDVSAGREIRANYALRF